MKIVDYVREQTLCSKCAHCIIGEGERMSCCQYGMGVSDQNKSTCGAWYLELTFQPDPVMKLDHDHKVIHAYDFLSWVNLYQARRVPQIRVLSREEWPEVTNA